MATPQKKPSTKTAKRKIAIVKTHPTKEELERVTKKAMKQYHTAIKKLARR